MQTEWGKLTIKSVMKRIHQYRTIGHGEFIKRFANGRNSKSTWISFEGELFPAKAIFAASFTTPVAPKNFNTSDTYIFCEKLGLELVRIENGEIRTKRSAIDDLDEFSGGELPNKKSYSGERFVRNPKVRAAVRERAQGMCEHCGEQGFNTSNGGFYLETHHIISLAHQGEDSIENVIALCANDHRRAHFGDNAETLEEEFKRVLSGMQQ